MAFARVSGVGLAGAAAVGTTGRTLAFGTNPSAGGLLVCGANIAQVGRTPTFSDTALNTWHPMGTFSLTVLAFTMALGWAIQPAGGADTVKVTWDTASSLSQEIMIGEFSGAPTSTVQDGPVSTFESASGTTGLGPTVPSSFPNDLLIAYMLASGNGGVGAGWTLTVSPLINGDPFMFEANVAGGPHTTAFTDTTSAGHGIICAALGGPGLPDLTTAPMHG